ncbi:TonB-dependent receptor [Brevundimonas aurantiaca]|jgi:iron complex outermembrane receptor protein|uniref:TonB-dependent receptor n=1 Tax=Brevundimonas aurantiaca TaxID=74316 RepID=UPI0019182F58|nr:TonB-dependent receptor [Brevundimonas aurantiaca]
MTICTRSLLAGVALVPIAAVAFATDAQAQTAREFNISGGSLDVALIAYARQADVQMLYTADLVAGLRTPGLSGRHEPDAALDRLLAGSGVVWSRSRPGVIVLRRAGSQQAAMADATQIDDIIVTGSLLRGPGESPSPVTVISRGDLDARGAGSIADVLTTLPQSYAGSATPGTLLTLNDTQGSNSSLSTGVNLRGLGEDSTLVLVNGRRIAGTGSRGEFADLSAIPGAALERVDVLLDGASALYGSDAVGGVVNVILRRSFDGQESRVRVATAQGGAEDFTASHLIGASWSSGSALISYEYQDAGALNSGDRAYTATGDLRPWGGLNYRSIYGAPGNIARFDAGLGAYVSAFAIRPGADGVARTSADFAAGQANLSNRRNGVDLLPNQERQTAYARFRQELGSRVELSGDLRWSDRSYEYASLSGGGLYTVTAANPHFVSPNGSTSHLIAYDFGRELGPTLRSGRSRSLATTLGADVGLGGSWSLDVYGSWAEEMNYGAQENQINTTFLNEALGSVADNPATPFSASRDGYLNLFGSGSANNAAVLDFISQGFDRDWARNRVETVNAVVDGVLMELPGGSLKLAAGANYRRETLRNRSAAFRSGVTPSESALTFRTREIQAAFFEVRAPLVGGDFTLPGIRRLELSVAARTEDYSDFGSTTNPKVGLIWEPFDGLTTRASWGTSFRAPALTELYERVQIGAANLASPTGSQLTLIHLGGNTELQPEEAESLTVGFEVRRPNGLRFGANYFDILFDDRIGRPASSNLTTVLSNPSLTPFLTFVNPGSSPADLALVQSYLSSPFYLQPGQYPAANFRVILDGRWANTGELRTRGVDFNAGYGFDLGRHRIELDAGGSYVLEYSRKLTPVAPREQLVDLVGYPADLRLQAAARWSFDDWGGRIGVNYVDDYRTLTNAKVASWTTVDAQLRWSPSGRFGLDGVDVALSAQNLFDEDPPFYNNPQGFGFDPANATILGRVVSLQLTKRW